jgi:hypothetical protein
MESVAPFTAPVVSLFPVAPVTLPIDVRTLPGSIRRQIRGQTPWHAAAVYAAWLARDEAAEIARCGGVPAMTEDGGPIPLDLEGESLGALVLDLVRYLVDHETDAFLVVVLDERAANGVLLVRLPIPPEAAAVKERARKRAKTERLQEAAREAAACPGRFARLVAWFRRGGRSAVSK